MSPWDSLLHQPEFWAGHLFDAVRGDEVEDTNDLLTRGLGLTWDQTDSFWVNRLYPKNPTDGGPPTFVIQLGEHRLEIDLTGEPYYETNFDHVSPKGQRTTWGITGGNFMLHAFRWPEVQAIARQGDLAFAHSLLLLIPVCDIEHTYAPEACPLLLQALTEVGVDGASAETYANILVEGLNFDTGWYEDPYFGWTIESPRSRRCIKRPEAGLARHEDEAFLALKSLMESLGVS